MDDIICGNIYLTISEHFCQFASVKREKIDIKNINIYSRDYLKFSFQDFIDVSIQNWNYVMDNPSGLLIFFGDSKYVWIDMLHQQKLKPKEIKLKAKPWITPEYVT